VLNVRSIVVALLCASPAVMLWDDLAVQGVLAGVIAIALVLTALSLRPGETEFLVSVSRPLAIAAIVPAAWIVFQVLPLRAFAHPIWGSTEAALGHSVAGAITIDLGASLIGLGQYLTLCGFAFLCTALAVDRQRAEWLLFALTAAGASVGLVVIWNNFVLEDFALLQFTLTQAIDCTVLGAIAAWTLLIRTVERFETRRANPLRSINALMAAFAASCAALLICAVALLADGTRGEMFAAGCGAAALVFVTIVRRFGLGPWGIAAVAVPMVGVAAVLVMVQMPTSGKNPLVAFANDSSASTTAISARVLEDAPLIGTGAGTFTGIAPVYREAGDAPSAPTAATTAATLAIELGRPMVWLALGAMVIAIIALFQSALQRGRDSFYPAMGASALIALSQLAFVNGGLVGNASGLMMAGTLGLAAAQRQSRSLQPS